MSWFGKRKDHPPVPVRGTTVDSPLDPGLAAQVQSWIERLAVPCAAIKAGSQVSSPSTSFISGHAYLPAGERWPMVDDNTYGLTFDDTMGLAGFATRWYTDPSMPSQQPAHARPPGVPKPELFIRGARRGRGFIRALADRPFGDRRRSRGGARRYADPASRGSPRAHTGRAAFP